MSNLPYVSEAEMRELGPEVRDWEPAGALCAGPDGLEDVAAVIRGLERLARPGELLVGWRRTRPSGRRTRTTPGSATSRSARTSRGERVLVARW